MSYIIYQQWIKGNERAAFPVVYNYVYNKNKFDKIDSQQPINTGSAGNEPNRKQPAAAADDIDDCICSSAASTPVYGKKAKKRKQPNQRTNDIDSDDDTVGIDSVDSVETITPERDVIERQQITVDIHDNRSNGSAVLIDDGKTASTKSYGSAVQKQRKYVDRAQLKLDINHNAVMAIDSGSESSDVSEIVNERRRQYQQRISVSSNSDSESAYATVELRNKVSFYLMSIDFWYGS